MEIEDVARVGLAAGRPAEQQGHLAVRVRVLREVVVHAERVPALVEEVLAHRAACVRCHPFDRRRLGRSRGDDDRVVHRARVPEALVDLRHGRFLLADGDVDTDDVGVALIEDRVDQDRGLTGAAVADDQLALPAADRDHRVDRLQARLERLLHRLAVDDARRLELHPAGLGRLDRALAVERLAERVDDPPDQRLADRNAGHTPGPLDDLALLDVLPGTEERGADVVLLEVEGEAGDAVLELQHLQRDGVLEPVDAGDAVADLQHAADFGEVGLDVVLLDPLLQDRGDLFGTKLQAPLPFNSRRSRLRRPRTLASRRSDPAWRTMPPIRSGSTLCVASTLRPEAFSICSITSRASWSESSTAVVTSTSRMPSSRATRRSNSRTISSASPARFCSASTSRKLCTSSSSPPSSSSRTEALMRWSSCGFRSRSRSSGTWRCASMKSPSSSRTASTRFSSRAAAYRARA